MGAEEYVLPPLYSPQHKAFDGKLMVETFISSLMINIGADRLKKLKFLMVDGSAGNHVARLHCEGHLREIYDRTDGVGQDDLLNFEQGLRFAFPTITFLSCIGHMICKAAQRFPKLTDYSCFKVWGIFLSSLTNFQKCLFF